MKWIILLLLLPCLAIGADWVNTNTVTVTLSMTDQGSGVCQYRMYEQGSTPPAWITVDPPVAMSQIEGPVVLTPGEGARTIVGEAADLAGNTKQITATVNIDTVPPELSLTVKAGG